MLNVKCFFKVSLLELAKGDLAVAELELLNARIGRSRCETNITHNIARIEHLRAAIGEKEVAPVGVALPLPVETRYTSSMPV